MPDYAAGVDKEFYFKKAEKYIKKNKVKDLLIVDRTRFGYRKESVQVYFKPFYRKKNKKRWNEIKMKCQSIQEYELQYKDENQHVHESFYVHPYIEFRKEEFRRCQYAES